MKDVFQKLLIITCLFISNISSAQLDTVFITTNKWLSDSTYYKTDTFTFSSPLARNYIVGTAALTSTHNQLMARGYGLFFEKVTKSDCKNEGERVYKIEDKINAVIETDSSYVIDINIVDNCCYDFLCDISVDSSGVLHLLYQGYGHHCACECCFGLTFHIKKLFHTSLGEIQGVMLCDKRNTIKMIKE